MVTHRHLSDTVDISKGSSDRGTALAKNPQEIQLGGFAALVQELDSKGRRSRPSSQTDEEVEEEGEWKRDQVPREKFVEDGNRHNEESMVQGQQEGPQLLPRIQQTSHHQRHLQSPQDVVKERVASSMDRNASVSRVLNGVHSPSKLPPSSPLHYDIVTPSGGVARTVPAAVWSTLSEAISSKGECLIPRCGEVRATKTHLHDYCTLQTRAFRYSRNLLVTKL